MKLNHLNLTVTDVPATREFLEAYFGLQKLGGNNNLTVLSDDSGFVLTLTSMKMANETEVRYPAIFHIGFSQETEERVNEINRRLKADGFDVPPPSRHTEPGPSTSRLPEGSRSRLALRSTMNGLADGLSRPRRTTMTIR